MRRPLACALAAAAALLAVLCAPAPAAGFSVPARGVALLGRTSPSRSSHMHRALRASAGSRDAADTGELSAGDRTRRSLLLQTAAALPMLLAGAQGAAAAPGGTVLVLGASGGIGQYVCQELLRKGYRVRGFTRRPEQAQEELKGARIEWVQGDLNRKADLAPAMKGVQKVVFCAGSHGWEDIENNRRIYAEAVGEAARLGKAEGIDRFLVVSSAGLDIMDPSSQYFQPQPRISKYLRDVLKWKLRGEQLVRASGVPYTIVRAYSLNNDAARIAATKDDTSTVVLQMRGDPATVGGVITRPNLATVTVEALLMPQTEGVTFEALDVRTSLNPEYPPWQKILKEDLEKDPPLTQEQLAQMSRPPPDFLSAQEKAEQAAGGAVTGPANVEWMKKFAQ